MTKTETETETIKVSTLTQSIIISIKKLSVYRMYLSQKKRLKLLLCMALLTANISFAETILPSQLVDKKGSSTSQPLEVLAVNDQQGADDNWDKYIEYETGSRGYVGIFRFNLPATPSETIQELTFHANYRGPEKSFQSWKFQLLNVQTGKWIKIADNRDAADWAWSDISSIVEDPGKFINSKNQITLRYKTRSSVDNSQLDFVAFKTKRSGSNPPEDTSDTPVLDDDPVVTPPPIVTDDGNRWQPVPGLKWQIQYEGTLDTNLNVDVYNIDLFDKSATDISELHSKGKRAICYFSAGSFENWRPDSGAFPASVLGRNLDGWAGEKWLDVRQLDILIPIMQTRMELAAQKGCDAVDPDNVDGYSNNTNFPLKYADQLAYNKALTEVAHSLGLAIGLKNNVDQIKDLVDYYDFAVNEECFQYDECDAIKPFVDAGKPVFGIEYNLQSSSFCPKANEMNFDFLKKRLSLNAWRESCR